MENPVIRDPNDAKVLEFYNSTDFDFTPELGAMFNGIGYQVDSGMKKHFPYHIAMRLAENLAKAVLIKGAPLHDPNAANPTGTPLWGDEGVKRLKATFITELYSESTPIAQTETEKLHARVLELEKLMAEKLKGVPVDTLKGEVKSVSELVNPIVEKPTETVKPVEAPKVYQDKQEVIAELEKRGVKFDRRQNKDNLMKLL